MNIQPNRRSTGILIALAVCMALQMTGFVMILPLFARRFESFGAGVAALSLSALAYALASTVAAPLMGILADRFGRRPVILLSLATYVLAFSGYLFATTAWLFILLRGIAGIFTAGLIPAITSMVGDVASENRRAQWIGIVNGGASVGWIVGPLFGGLLYDRFGYVIPFAISIVMEMIALLLAGFLVPETHSALVQSDRSPWSWVRGLDSLPALPTFYMLMLLSFGVMFAWAFIEPQFMFYAYDDLAWTSSRLGFVMSTYGLACMLGEFALGQLSDRLGRKPVLVLGLALFSAQFIGLVIFRNATWIMVSFLLAGLGNAIYDPALSAFVMDITPVEHTARILGIKSTAGSLGNMLGPGLVMLITPYVGARVIFLLSSILVLVLTCAAALVLRARPGNETAPDFASAPVP